MKKKLIIFFLLLFLFPCLIFSKGSIGASIEHSLILSPHLSSQGVCVGIEGKNFFTPKNNFGIEYSFLQPFMFGERGGDYSFNIDAAALYNFTFNSFLSLDTKLGFDYNYIKKQIFSINDFGMLLGVNVNFGILKFLALSLKLEYTFPILRNYNNTIKFVPFDTHNLRYGITVSYLY